MNSKKVRISGVIALLDILVTGHLLGVFLTIELMQPNTGVRSYVGHSPTPLMARIGLR